MKNKATITLQPIIVQTNTDNKNKNRWARIKCVTTGKVLHTGSPSYIKRVAKRYNKIIVEPL